MLLRDKIFSSASELITFIPKVVCPVIYVAYIAKLMKPQEAPIYMFYTQVYLAKDELL